MIRYERGQEIPKFIALPSGVKKFAALLEQSVKDRLFVCLRWNLSVPQRSKGHKVLPLCRRKDHKLEQCVTFRRIFDEKHKVDESLFQEEVVNINGLLFPKSNDKGKGQAMMAPHREIESEGEE